MDQEDRKAHRSSKKAKIFAMSHNFRKFFSTNVVPKLRDSAQNPISTSDEEMTTTSTE